MATRPASRRLEKWDAKFAGDVLPERLREYKARMREQLSVIFPTQEALENEVKLILSEAGVQTYLNPAYLAFAREVYRLATKFSGRQLVMATDIVLNKWASRGLERDLLERIRNSV
ncbi:MAG: hypothetical protein NZ601_00230, partial [candidate division WOR-3 bacterium]|nr:hypothetical protein [candidate division WOR-3 bacterium]